MDEAALMPEDESKMIIPQMADWLEESKASNRVFV